MIIAANLLAGIASVLDSILYLYSLLMIARVIISWVSADPYNPIVRFIVMATEPVIAIVRRALPRIPGPFDWSILIVFLLILFLQTFLVSTLKDYAAVMRREALIGGVEAPVRM